MSEFDASELEQLLFDILHGFSNVTLNARFIASIVTAFDSAVDLDVESLDRQERRQWRLRFEKAFSDEQMELFRTQRDAVQEQMLELSDAMTQLQDSLEKLDAAAMEVDPLLITFRKF